MFAAPRRRALLMLWLVLALLPLRGWAGLAMHLPATEAAAPAAPCHAEATASTAGDDALNAVCSLCELCHGAMLWPALQFPEPDRPAQRWLAAAPAQAPSAEPGQLFRPPRR